MVFSVEIMLAKLILMLLFHAKTFSLVSWQYNFSWLFVCSGPKCFHSQLINTMIFLKHNSFCQGNSLNLRPLKTYNCDSSSGQRNANRRVVLSETKVTYTVRTTCRSWIILIYWVLRNDANCKMLCKTKLMTSEEKRRKTHTGLLVSILQITGLILLGCIETILSYHW